MTEPTPDAEFTAAVLAAAGQAVARGGILEQHLDVAGVRIDLRYASSALQEIFSPALAHLEIGAETGVDRTPTIVTLWDSASTGIPVPPPPVTRDRFTDRGDLLGMNDPAYRTAFHWSEYSVCVFDIAAAQAAYWVADPAHLPYWARSSPLRTILGWVLAHHGRQLLHAAAVATGDSAVVIAGSGGSGKSTTSLTCLEAGLDFLGDDYVAVSLDPPTVHSLYATAKISDRSHPALRDLPTLPVAEGDEKFVIQLYPAAGDRLRRSAPLRAIVTPQVVDSETTDVIEVDRDRIEHAATFTSLAQLPHAGAEARERISRMLDAVPTGLLRLGRDRAGVVDAVRRVALDTAPAAAPVVTDDLPSVTVIIPVHNGAHFLADAVESVLAQHYPRLEIVVVDDGSDDDLAGAVAALPADVRVQHQATAGPAAARNTGIRLATGELLAFLDVDDTWPAGSLLTLVRDWAVGGAPVVIGRAQVVDLDSESGEQVPIGTPDTAFPYYIGSAIYERGIFDSIGEFDATMMYAEDTDWFTRLSESGTALRRLSTVTLIVRRHGDNMTEGRDLIELHVVRAVKKALDRRRLDRGVGSDREA